MRIIRIDPTRRRMGLSLKRVTDPQYADLDWQAELGAEEPAAEAPEIPSEQIPEEVDYEAEAADVMDEEGDSFEAEEPLTEQAEEEEK